MEWGLRRGLAVDLDWNRKFQMDRAADFELRRKRDEASAKAKMFADDADYINVANSYDNPRIKAFAESKIRDLGKFQRENPDWETDPQLRLIRKQILHSLKDNPYLNQGLQTEEAFKRMNEFEADPKNSALINSPEYQTTKRQRDVYLQKGNQYGEDNNPKPFTFQPPSVFDEDVYLEARFSKIPTKTRRLTSKEYGAYPGAGATISDVSPDRARVEAISVLNDQAVSYKFVNNWNNFSDEQKKSFGGNIVDYIAILGRNHTKSEMKTGQYDFSDHGGNGRNNTQDYRSIWETMHQGLTMASGQKADLNAERIQKTFGDGTGNIYLDGATTPLGDILPASMYKAQATGWVESKQTPDGKIRLGFDVMPKFTREEFYKLGDNYYDLVNEKGIGQVYSSNPDWELTDEAMAKGFKKIDATGTEPSYITFPSTQVYNPNNAQYSDRYAESGNVSPHREDPYQRITDKSKIKVSPDGKQYQDSNGYIYDVATGKRIQ